MRYSDTRTGNPVQLYGMLLRMKRPPFDYAVENYPLAPETIYKIGGAADFALLPRTREELIEAYQWMQQQDGPKLILGGGSNVLISDAGFPGVVLFTTALDAIEPAGPDRYAIDCGVVLDRIVREVIIANQYAGTGGLTGIPGSVGGAIFMNAGTVNGTICQLMESVDVVSGEGTTTVPMNESLYGYRGQTFCPPGGLILGGMFRFQKSGEDQQAIYDHYIARRKEKQPKGHCCGSVFKNPKDDHAGRLIEACGLKGTSRGGAVVSPLHANFIVNEDDASFADIIALVQLCKDTVRDRFGIELEEEVRIIAP